MDKTAQKLKLLHELWGAYVAEEGYNPQIKQKFADLLNLIQGEKIETTQTNSRG